MDPYQILGLGRGATSEQVKAAFRARARQHHPDHGGDPEQFHLARTAYGILIDPKDRAFYDRHGSSRDEFDPRSEALAVVSQWLMEVVDHCPDLRQSDIVAEIIRVIIRQRMKYKQDRMDHCREPRRLAMVRSRLSKRDSEIPALLAKVLDDRRSQVVQSIRDLADANLVLDAAEEIMADYSYRTDPDPVRVEENEVRFQMGRPIVTYSWGT